MNHPPVAIGIDVGTQTVRVLAVTPEGKIAAAITHPIAQSVPTQPGHHEQQPESWWQATFAGLQQVCQHLPPGTKVAGIAIDGTSGTLLALDKAGEPLGPAIMYNDNRSAAHVPQVRQASQALEATLGYAFASSFTLPKIIWLKQEKPTLFARTHTFAHPTDFIVGRLTGQYCLTDSNNAFKTGYDLLNGCWPDFISTELGIPMAQLPTVVSPGTAIAPLTRSVAEAIGLPPSTLVYAGTTDSIAAHLATGAIEPGQWTTTLGTTLVIKGVSEKLLLDPQHRLYCHHLAGVGWLPGGASNTGAEWVAREHRREHLSELTQRATSRLPTSLLRYPLMRQGERFPWQNPTATGFVVGQARDDVDLFAAGLKGVGFVERRAYELMAQLGGVICNPIYVAGGAAQSDVWLKVRASILGRPVARPHITESALGAALLVASQCWYGSIAAASQALVKIDTLIEPDPAWQTIYAERYSLFLDELAHRVLAAD